MASVNNDWVGYLDRSFQQIKTSVLGRITTVVPEMTDHSASNIWIVTLDIFSAIAEMLGFYIDNAAQEAFIVTARRLTSVIKLSRGLDYRVRAASPERVDLLITWNAPTPAFILALGFKITGSGGIIYTLMNDVSIPLNSTTSLVPISQESLINLATVTDGTKNQKISLGTNYVDGSIQLQIESIDYDQVKTFANSAPGDLVFIVEVLEDGNAYIILGDGINGILPINGSAVTGTYTTTLGPNGAVGAGGFDATTIVVGAPLPGGVTIVSANTSLNSSGGTGYEDIESIRTNAILSIRTLDRMVTRSDHEYVLGSVPGVAHVKTDFACGKLVNNYIVPDGGGIASSGLISEVQAVAEDSKIVGLNEVILAAGQTRLVLVTNVTANKRKSLTDTKTQVDNALLDFGAVQNQVINGAIRISDIEALIDNLSNVSFVDIISMYTIPYPRPVIGSNALNWTTQTTDQSVAPINWSIEFNGANFNVFRNSVSVGVASVGVQFISPSNDFKFTINAGTYAIGNTWNFIVMPFLADLQLTDFTIFTIEIGDITNNILPYPVN